MPPFPASLNGAATASDGGSGQWCQRWVTEGGGSVTMEGKKGERERKEEESLGERNM